MLGSGSTKLTPKSRPSKMDEGSAWVEYDSARKPKPVVPEPAAYGISLVLIIVLIHLMRKNKK